MKHENILKKIREGNFKVKSYYTYPTGTIGDPMFTQSVHSIKDDQIKQMVDSAFDQAMKHFGIRPDNKTALKIEVEGEPVPYYISLYDDRQSIVGTLNTHRGGREMIIAEWNAQPQLTTE